MLFTLRRGIFLAWVLSAGVLGLTGGLTISRLGSTIFSFERFCPEKIGSRMFSVSEGSTIFFLRSAVLSELETVQSTTVYSCFACTAYRTGC